MPAASEKQEADCRDRRRIRRDAKNLRPGRMTSLWRCEQRLSGECEGKEEIPYPTRNPASVEGEAVEQRPGDEE